MATFHVNMNLKIERKENPHIFKSMCSQNFMTNTKTPPTNITEKVVGLLTVINYSNEISVKMRDSFDKLYNPNLDSNVSNIANQIFAGAGMSVIKKMHDEIVNRIKTDVSVSPEEIFLSVKGEMRLLSEQDRCLVKNTYPVFKAEDYDALKKSEKDIFQKISGATNMYANNSTSQTLIEMLNQHNAMPPNEKSAILTGYVGGKGSNSAMARQSNSKKTKR